MRNIFILIVLAIILNGKVVPITNPMFVIFILLLLFFCMPNSKKYVCPEKYVQIFIFPFILMAIQSFFFYVNGDLNFLSLRRGISSVVYYIIAILFVYRLYKNLGNKTIDFFFLAMCLSYSIDIIAVIFSFGFEGIYQNLIAFFDKGVATGGMSLADRYLEDHTLVLSFPLYFLYYFFKDHKTRDDKKRMFLAILFTLLGGKRIIVAALLMTFFLILYKKILFKKYIIYSLSLFAIVLCYFYVYSIKTGLFILWTDSHNVNLMLRDRIIDFVDRLYSFDIGYVGLGTGFLSKYFEHAYSSGNIAVLGLHNDILKRYIELGFIGFGFYLIYYFIYSPLKLSKINPLLSIYFIIFQCYAFITYATDNTSEYTCFQISLFLVPLSLLGTQKGKYILVTKKKIYE